MATGQSYGFVVLVASMIIFIFILYKFPGSKADQSGYIIFLIPIIGLIASLYQAYIQYVQQVEEDYNAAQSASRDEWERLIDFFYTHLDTTRTLFSEVFPHDAYLLNIQATGGANAPAITPDEVHAA